MAAGDAAATPAFAVSLRRFLLAFASVFLFWLLLTASLDIEELLAGVLVSVVVALVALPRTDILDGLRITPALPIHVLSYLGVFSIALVRANLDLARRVLDPRLPINPAVVTVRTSLKSNLGRMLLANSITLTPGTLTVDVIDDRLLVHWVYCPEGTDPVAAAELITSGFERHLGRFLK
ncbi:MAG: Na+/H+ antiporter subunit E [Pseudomonadota bacterium]